MDLQDYKKAFAQAQTDLEKLIEEREEIDRKISKLKQAIIGLAPLADEASAGSLSYTLVPEFTAFGITDAIREVLNSAEKWLTPLEVRERLVQMKPNMKEQANLMASIHSVLKRLVPKEAVFSTNKSGDTVYRWKIQRENVRARSRMAQAFARAKEREDILKYADELTKLTKK
jgi:predicted transcriptional regulator